LVKELAGEYPVRLLCQLVGLAPSSYYHESRLPADTQLRDQIEQIALLYPRYGYRRITVELSRRGIVANHKAVLRIMREESLLVVVRRYVHTTWSGHDLRRFANLLKGRVVEAADEVWCADITYIRLGQGFVYLAVVLDIYTRLVKGWALGCGLDASLTMRALEQALASGRPKIHHSDQGVQYCAEEYVEAVLGSGAAVSMAATGQPTENAYAERWIRTLKEEEVYLHEYRGYADARDNIAHFIDDVYNTKRIHSSLGYLTPAEFAASHVVLGVVVPDQPGEGARPLHSSLVEVPA
jgi:putative transposase